jgi:hypothetical protein
MVKTFDVEDGYCGLAANVAVTEFAPEARKVPLTGRVQLPPSSVQLPSGFVPALKLTVPVGTGGIPTSPVPPPVTVAFNVVVSLAVIEVEDAVNVVALVNAVYQLAIRLLTFTLPMPVAWS